MNLPRNVRAKNTNMHNRNASNREINRKINELDVICQKHKIGNLTFRNCKFANSDGKVTFIEHDHVRGNMRSGVMIVRANMVEPSELIYDIVEIEKNKRERDEKKRQDEMEKARLEIERYENANKKNQLSDKGSDRLSDSAGFGIVGTIPNRQSETTEHKKLLENLVDHENKIDVYDKLTEEGYPNTEPVDQPTESIITETIEPTKEISNDECPNDEHQDNTDKNQKNKSAKTKREKAIKQMQEQLAKKNK